MPIIVEVDDDFIDEGDTKTVRVAPQAADGSVASLQSLSVEVDPRNVNGTKGDYSLSDFSSDGGDLVVTHTFDASGFWDIDAVGTDAQGNTERASTRHDPIYVMPEP